MGLLIRGQWVDRWYDTKSTNGRFVRSEAQFRNWITADGSAGPTGEGGFKAAAGRYHLYVSLACPWAHRTLIFRALKGLESMIGVSVLNPFMGSQGWSFEAGEGVTGDGLYQSGHLYELRITSYNVCYTKLLRGPITGTIQSPPTAALCVARPSFATGSPRMAVPVPPGRGASRQPQDATTSMCHWPAPGRTGP